MQSSGRSRRCNSIAPGVGGWVMCSVLFPCSCRTRSGPSLHCWCTVQAAMEFFCSFLGCVFLLLDAFSCVILHNEELWLVKHIRQTRLWTPCVPPGADLTDSDVRFRHVQVPSCHVSPQNYNFVFPGETIVNVLDFKKDAGLWHGILTVSWAWTGLLKHFTLFIATFEEIDLLIQPFLSHVNLQLSVGSVGASSEALLWIHGGVEADGERARLWFCSVIGFVSPFLNLFLLFRM